MAVTITDKGNYVEIDRGEPSRRFVVKPFDVNIRGANVIQIGDGLKNDWDFDIADLTGWTYSDIYDLKDQLLELNNTYWVTVKNTGAEPIPVSGTFTPDAIQFKQNGNNEYVEQDTVTPANNRPLPTDLYDANGQRGTFANPLHIDKSLLATSAKQDTAIAELQELNTEVYLQNTYGESWNGPTSYSATASRILLMAANANRKEVYITNTSQSILHVVLSPISYTPASTFSPIQLAKGETYIGNSWKGAIYGHWESPASSGSAIVHEIYR